MKKSLIPQYRKPPCPPPSGKKVHFGSPKYPDYTIHKDKERRDKYLTRATKIKNKQGELTYTNPESANFWLVYLLWPKK